MNKLYTRIQLITPPIFFNILKNTYIYSLLRNYKNKVSRIKPKLHTVSNGVLRDRKLFFNGTIFWQKEMLDGSYDNFFFDYLKKINLSGKTIVDIGAHIGYHSLCFAEIVGKNGKVLTFEPNPYNITYIDEILKNNPDLAERIKLFKIAISDKNGVEDFIFSDRVEEGMSSGSFIDSADTIWEKEIFETKTGFKRMKTQTSKLDSLDIIKNEDISPNIIKIDVEGAESLVLEGAKETILKHSPIVLLEVHSIPNMYWVMNFFKGIGYATELLKKEKDGRCFLSATKS